MENLKKYAIYGGVGLGAFGIGYLIHRLLSKRKSTPLKGEPKITEVVTTESLVATDDTIPSIAMAFENGEYVYYELNYTPQPEKDNWFEISVEDYQRLQSIGVIPEDFPLDQIVAVPSHNGRNWFFVGYSDPFSLKTARDDLKVIQPLWFVSYGLNFDSESTPPDGFEDERLFMEMANRALFAEWLLTNRGENGCHRNQSLSVCNAERAAIVSLILERLKRKQERIDSNLSYGSIFYGPGQQWNKHSSFMSTFEGKIPDIARSRFLEFYRTAFWSMPQLNGFAVGFIHHKSMRSGGKNPLWIKQAQPMPEDANSYLANHTIKIGNAVFIDVRRTFK